MVGAMNTEKAFLAHSRKVVITFDNHGNLERSWELDENNTKISINPRYLASTKDGTVFVADWLSNHSGRVVVLREDGGILKTITGHPDKHRDGILFKPNIIKRTPAKNILVCDWKNNTLCLLNR